jgi:phosphate/sulfate permease
MTASLVFSLTGFLLASYAVVANDVIQTLGTFLTSNSKKPWWVLWGYAGSILAVTLVIGWWLNDGDVTYGRLSNIPLPEEVAWWFILPPLILLFITLFGWPVSTTFMILAVFSSTQVIEKMVLKSLTGYVVAFVFAFLVYILISRRIESRAALRLSDRKRTKKYWMIAQWFSTGFLWSQWLIQDFANIYVYLPRELNPAWLAGSLVLILAMLAFVFWTRGGKIQEIVKQKTNSAHIRSATLIDLTYGIVLYLFTMVSTIPMSTTWAFVGVLAGREFAINVMLSRNMLDKAYKKIFRDLYKINAGLAISVIIALLIRLLK